MAEESGQAQAVEEEHREGARWINYKPTAEQFAAWFERNAPIDERLQASKYVGGMVLIPAVDNKVKYIQSFGANGVPVIAEKTELAYIPYPKVEARIEYFWDLMDARKDEWIGIVEPVRQRSMEGTGGLAKMQHALPEGFTIFSVPQGDGYTHFLVCTYRVAVYERETYVERISRGNPAQPVREGIGSKQVPFLKGGRNNSWPDPDAIMKAETGAKGRALGFAGILNIPGAGVATAEDMLESLGATATAAQPSPDATGGPELPPAAGEPRTEPERREQTRAEMISTLASTIQELHDDYPAAYAGWTEFLQQRRLRSIEDADDATLKGLVKKAEKLKDDAELRAQQNPPPEQAQPTQEMTAPNGE